MEQVTQLLTEATQLFEDTDRGTTRRGAGHLRRADRPGPRPALRGRRAAPRGRGRRGHHHHDHGRRLRPEPRHTCRITAWWTSSGGGCTSAQRPRSPPSGWGTSALAAPVRRAPLSADPFTLGVASGDPAADSFVLWTRLAPDPLNGGGMPPDPVAVTWEVAGDDAFATVVASGTVNTVADLAHTVHVEVDGLDPGASYWYRFGVEGWQSPMGAPAALAVGIARRPAVRVRVVPELCQRLLPGAGRSGHRGVRTCGSTSGTTSTGTGVGGRPVPWPGRGAFHAGPVPQPLRPLQDRP